MDTTLAPPAAPALQFSDGFRKEITDRFGLDEAFVRKLVAGRRFDGKVIERWEDLVNPAQSMSSAYLHFALSNVVRGRQTRDVIMRKTGIRGGRSLDVGSAYGGMVVAFSEAGFQASGIEIDPTWCELGNLNCTSRGFGTPIRLADFLAEPLEGRFDVVTCNDVIEHVMAPRTAIERMADLLLPGGVLYLMVPNAWSHDHVLRDGHYGQFGMNLLDHFAAREYYDLRCKSTYGKPYSCGEFHPLGWYREQLARCGLSVEVHRTTSSRLPADEQVRDIIAGLDAAFAGWKREGLPEILADQVAQRFLDYRRGLLDAYAHAQTDAGAVLPFLETYMDSFWMIFARRAPAA